MITKDERPCNLSKVKVRIRIEQLSEIVKGACRLYLGVIICNKRFIRRTAIERGEKRAEVRAKDFKRGCTIAVLKRYYVADVAQPV